MGRTANYSDQACSVAATLEVIGDPWTLLIIRDAFRGLRRFEQWQESLGVARNVLAARLKSLVAQGVLVARLYNERPPRREYVLTAKGRDLQPVLLAMLGWGDKHVYGPERAPVRFVHKGCGQPFVARTACAHCGEIVGPRDLAPLPAPADAMTVGQAFALNEAEKATA